MIFARRCKNNAIQKGLFVFSGILVQTLSIYIDLLSDICSCMMPSCIQHACLCMCVCVNEWLSVLVHVRRVCVCVIVCACVNEWVSVCVCLCFCVWFRVSTCVPLLARE